MGPWFSKRTRVGERGEPDRESNPDTPPDTNDPAGLCPRCGRASNFELLGSLPLTFGAMTGINQEGRREADVLDQVSAFVCTGCRQGTAVVEERWVGDHPSRGGIGGGGVVTYRGVFWWPPPASTDLDESIPVALRDCYAEGMRCLSAQAPRAAVAMLRRTVEALVMDRGSELAQKAMEANLAKALRLMADEHALDATLAEWANEIRLLGNVGAHFDPMRDVDLAEAQDLGKLTRQLLHYVYELPASIRRKRKAAESASS